MLDSKHLIEKIKIAFKFDYQRLHVRVERVDLFDSLILVRHQLSQAGLLDQPLRVQLGIEGRRVDVVRIPRARNKNVTNKDQKLPFTTVLNFLPDMYWCYKYSTLKTFDNWIEF